MPELCRFYGISVHMYYGDHAPAHFHARYGDEEAVVAIESLAVTRGHLSPRANGLVVERASQHQPELNQGGVAGSILRVKRSEGTC